MPRQARECRAHVRRHWSRWEEKETDVAIACRLLRLAASEDCEQVALRTGDTDLVPAVKEAKMIRADLDIGVVFPASRSSAHLRRVADWSLRLDASSYGRHQLPEAVMGPHGERIDRPPEWS